MHAIIRRYDGVDQNRTTELTSKVNETLMPKLNKLPGFKGYYLIDAGNGVFTSLGHFETPEQRHGVDEARRNVDPRGEARDDSPQRAQDHERQDRCSQQRPRSRRRVARRTALDGGLGLAGPSARYPDGANQPSRFSIRR